MNSGQKKEMLSFDFQGDAQLMLFEKYGDPCEKGWGARWLFNWEIGKDFKWFPSIKMCIHKDFRPQLFNAFQQLQDQGLHREIKTLEEAYCIRFINGSSSVLSVHSWGVALDLNSDENPLGSCGTWSDGFTSVMSKNGIYCGQNWIGRKDPMHFAMVNG